MPDAQRTMVEEHAFRTQLCNQPKRGLPAHHGNDMEGPLLVQEQIV